MKDGGRGVKNILSLFHMVVDNMIQHIQSVPNIYWVQRQACIKYHSFWHTDLPAIQQPFYRPLRIGAAIGKFAGNFEDGFGGKLKVRRISHAKTVRKYDCQCVTFSCR